MEVFLTIFGLLYIRILLLNISHRNSVVKLPFDPVREVLVLLSDFARAEQLFASLVPVLLGVHVLLPNESLSSFHCFSLDVISSLREQITQIKKLLFVHAHENNIWQSLHLLSLFLAIGWIRVLRQSLNDHI